jgi:hypothetical protein
VEGIEVVPIEEIWFVLRPASVSSDVSVRLWVVTVVVEDIVGLGVDVDGISVTLANSVSIK